MKILRYILVASTVFIIAALVWWYVFLRAEQGALQTIDAGRGANAPAPTFESFIGSTYENIVSNLSGEGNGTEENGVPRLRRITQSPVAGYGFVSNPLGTGAATSSARVRFVERATGYIFETSTDTNELTRITNTLFPKVYEAHVGKNGVVIIRGIDDNGNLATSVGIATTTPGSSSPKALSLTALSQNIEALVLKPSGDTILYIRENPDGTPTLMQALWNNANAKTLAETGISGWQLQFLEDGRIFLVQNIANGIVNNAYEVKGGRLLQSVGGVRGLMFLPQENSESVLYSSEDGTLSARMTNDVAPVTLPIKTTADKCVWAKAPSTTVYCAVPRNALTGSSEARLRGEIYTSDFWWSVEANSGNAKLLFSSDAPVDVENARLTSGDPHILFMNAIDKTLWALRIAE